MYIKLIICSHLGKSDGGRETWLRLFLKEIFDRHKDVFVDIYCLGIESDNFILSSFSNNNRLNVIQLPIGRVCKYKSLKFIYFLSALIRNSKPVTKTKYICVGGLIEFLALLLSFPRCYGSGALRIAWLRTIFSREMGNRIPSYLGVVVQFLEAVLLNHFFHRVISNGGNTTSYYQKRVARIAEIPNAVAKNTYPTCFDGVARPLRVLFAGRLSKVKGIAQFFDAASTIKRNQNLQDIFEFHVIGKGDEYYQDIAVMLDCEGTIIYHGAVSNDDLIESYCHFDICVALTLSNSDFGGGGVSNALLEQLAAGKLIVAWDNPIFQSVLSDTNSVLVKAQDSSNLCSTLKMIADRPEKYTEHARRGLELSNKFSIEQHVESFMRVIEGDV